MQTFLMKKQVEILNNAQFNEIILGEGREENIMQNINEIARSLS